ncbi:MAG: aminopeptidase P family protein [Chloroflexi bacterium]|nr:aminopeptidase P family protein [Chloroflexota bacterium]
MIRKDKRVLGQTKTLYEPGVDLERMRWERLKKVQVEMTKRDIGALVLTDINNIRYTTGIAVMPIWTALNLAHYVLVPAEGSPILFEFGQAMFRAETFFKDVRPAHYWQARFAEHMAPQKSAEWAAEIETTLQEWGVTGAKVGIDVLDYYGFSALQAAGLTLTDCDEPLERARQIKTLDEIELMRQSAAVCEAALYDLEQAIRPGVTENELLGVYWHKLCAMGGEYVFTRLLSSGYKTNPWFHEAGSKMVRPGDLVAFDTDTIGPEGYGCDISRTFLCGDNPTPVQIEAYQVAYNFVMEVAEMLKPGLSFEDLAKNAPSFPKEYWEQRYSVILHGIGTDDEPPFVPFDAPGEKLTIPEGEFKENMVVSVEFYAGKVGEQDGVKLEDEVWITADGPVLISLYPYEDKLLG